MNFDACPTKGTKRGSQYISREAAIEAITTAEQINNGGNKYNRYPPSHDEVLKRINSLPAADVQEVKKGKWEERKEGWGEYWICTSCGGTLDTLDGEPPEAQDWKYCPYCGADMREEQT